MPLIAQTDFGDSVQQGVANVVEFVPQFLGFLLILIIGYFVAKLIAKAIDKVLERVGFDRAVQRGGVGKALHDTRYDASGILSKLVFFALMLFVLQLAFGVFGPNPISELLTGIISYLPRVFVAIVIIVVTAAIAAAVKEIVEVSLGGLSYGRVLAMVSSVAILTVGVFAALNQLQIAQPIVNGLFYAILAIIAGSAIIAIGGGGILPMRQQWEKALTRVQEEAPRIKEEAQEAKEDIRERAERRRRNQQHERADRDESGDGPHLEDRRPDRQQVPPTPEADTTATDRTVQLPEDSDQRDR